MGQESIAKGLAQAIAAGRIGHAFLFIGSRGTGKTSSARILAKALNCAKGPAPKPCGACDSCQAIEDGTDVDVLEIDAASNNGVDDVRALRERVGFAPMRGRYRITILDEVHMLSTGAFNALLKTLEEPPAHAKFIFATTAPEKIPDTIRSRCQVYEFRRIETAAIVRRLTEICALEGVKVPESCLTAIASASRGGMRDSLSLLDQLIAYAGPNPTEDDFASLTGAAGKESIARLADAVIDGERAEILRLVGAHAGAGGEAEELLDQAIDRFRAVMIAALCGADTDLLEEPPAVRVALDSQAKRCGAGRAEAILQHLVHAREKARFMGPLVRAWIESALLAASRSDEVNAIPALLTRIEELERRLAGGAAAPAASAAARPAPAPGAERPAAAPAAQVSRPTAAPGPTAATLLTALAERNAFGRNLKDLSQGARLEGNTLTVSLPQLDAAKRTMLFDPANRAAAERWLGERVPGARLVLREGDALDARPAPGDRAPISAPEPPPLPSADLSPAVRFALEATGGRILGRTRVRRPPAAAEPPAGASAADPHEPHDT